MVSYSTGVCARFFFLEGSILQQKRQHRVAHGWANKFNADQTSRRSILPIARSICLSADKVTHIPIPLTGCATIDIWSPEMSLQFSASNEENFTSPSLKAKQHHSPLKPVTQRVCNMKTIQQTVFVISSRNGHLDARPDGQTTGQAADNIGTSWPGIKGKLLCSSYISNYQSLYLTDLKNHQCSW